jgi:hypothetical protein
MIHLGTFKFGADTSVMHMLSRPLGHAPACPLGPCWARVGGPEPQTGRGRAGRGVTWRYYY